MKVYFEKEKRKYIAKLPMNQWVDYTLFCKKDIANIKNKILGICSNAVLFTEDKHHGSVVEKIRRYNLRIQFTSKSDESFFLLWSNNGIEI